jgi:SAM-dependent methyltransferase
MRIRPIVFGLVLFILVVTAAFFFAGAAGTHSAQAPQQEHREAKRTPDVVFVPTPMEVVEKMLSLAQVSQEDVVYDLGCGDGRLVVTAAKKYGARGVGIDIDPQRVAESKANAAKENVTGRVRFMEADLFETDISEATAVTLYLLPELNVRLRPKLFRELRPGTPIVSHDFDMGEWKPDQTVAVEAPDRVHTVYFWVIPADVSGAWTWTEKDASGKDVDYRLDLDQDFQNMTGTLSVDGREQKIEQASVTGDRLSFTVYRGEGQAPATFSGRVSGNVMSGSVERPGERASKFSAERSGVRAPAAR